MDLRAGDRFGRYAIEGLLGRGGMGVVYRGVDTVLRRPVALKILGVRDEARLLDEARAVAALEHPHIVRVHDVGEVDGCPFISMELVDGESLRARMADPAISLDARLRWLREIAAALTAAHARGVVHRDIKPENVMIDAAGAVRVLDFGIARRPDGDPPVSSRRGAPPSGSGASRVTGTPAYMAPEQLWGQPLDGRADQFAWGVVAYELLTGRLPWRTTAAHDLVAEIVSIEPPPIPADRAPEQVRAAVTRALSKGPDDRFPSMKDAAAALDEASDEPSPAARPAGGGEGAPRVTEQPVVSRARSALPPGPPPPRRRTGWLLGAALTLVALTGAVFVWRASRPTAPRAGSPAAPADATFEGTFESWGQPSCTRGALTLWRRGRQVTGAANAGPGAFDVEGSVDDGGRIAGVFLLQARAIGTFEGRLDDRGGEGKSRDSTYGCTGRWQVRLAHGDGR